MPLFSGEASFISKNINFTSKTRFSIGKTLEMPFFSGKYGFYHEKENFYVENTLFYEKILQMPFNSGKNVFIRKNKKFTSKTIFSSQQKKLEMTFYSRKAGFY